MDFKKIAKMLENKDDLVVNEVVLNKAQKEGQVIYGARAYNLQSPQHLRKVTYDYDILSKKPKKAAKEVAETLKRRLGKEVKVVAGKHKGTYRVKIDEEVVADYTQLKTKPKTKKVWGAEVRDIKSLKRNVQRIVKKPGTEYRREKDIDTLSRINKIEEIENKWFN